MAISACGPSRRLRDAPTIRCCAAPTKSHPVRWGVSYFQYLPGKGDAYNKALSEVSFPVFDEMVKRKTIVSYTALNQVSGAGEYSSVLIVSSDAGSRTSRGWS